MRATVATAMLCACGAAPTLQLRPHVAVTAEEPINSECVQAAIDAAQQLGAERIAALGDATPAGASIAFVRNGDMFMGKDLGQTRETPLGIRAVVLYRGGSLATTSLCHELLHVLLYAAHYGGEHHQAPGIFEVVHGTGLTPESLHSAEWECCGKVIECEQRQ